MCLRILIIALIVVLINVHITIPDDTLMYVLLAVGAGIAIDLAFKL